MKMHIFYKIILDKMLYRIALGAFFKEELKWCIQTNVLFSFLTHMTESTISNDEYTVMYNNKQESLQLWKLL